MCIKLQTCRRASTSLRYNKHGMFFCYFLVAKFRWNASQNYTIGRMRLQPKGYTGRQHFIVNCEYTHGSYRKGFQSRDPESRYWRCFNPGISGLWIEKLTKCPNFTWYLLEKYFFSRNFGRQFPAIKLKVSRLTQTPTTWTDAIVACWISCLCVSLRYFTALA